MSDQPRITVEQRNAAIASLSVPTVGDPEAHVLKAWCDENPEDAEAAFTLGNYTLQIGQYDTAVYYYVQCVTAAQEVPEAWCNLGVALYRSQKSGEAATAFQRALALNPRMTQAWNMLGHLNRDHGRLDEAEHCYRNAATGQEGTINLGQLLLEQRRFQEAEAIFFQATKQNAQVHAVWLGLALARNGLEKTWEALEAIRRALTLAPEDYGTIYNGALMYQTAGQHRRAVELLEQALTLNPADKRPLTFLPQSQLALCRWEDCEAVLVQLGQADVPLPYPFVLAATSADGQTRLKSAQRVAEAAAAEAASTLALLRRPTARHADKKLRIGFLSPDFRGHSAGRTFLPLLQAHDRADFDWYGYDLRGHGDETTQAFRESFGSLKDISRYTLKAATEQIMEDGIDILVDLAGPTNHCRFDILSLRPAPIQAHYLGYGATTGASYIDYLITDAVVTPEAFAADCSEAIVRLPHSFMPAQALAQPTPTSSRRAEGLPEDAIVLANFNAFYKFDSPFFSVWMSLLHSMPKAVLWLRDGEDSLKAGLVERAKQAGIDPARLIFAKRVSPADHLHRLGLADLALDPHFHVGGATTLDAISVGLPVVTLAGPVQSSRTGASILQGANLPELITNDITAYQALALNLGQDEKARLALRHKILTECPRSPLFDLPALALNLEAAYKQMWEQHQRGQTPTSFSV